MKNILLTGLLVQIACLDIKEKDSEERREGQSQGDCIDGEDSYTPFAKIDWSNKTVIPIVVQVDVP